MKITNKVMRYHKVQSNPDLAVITDLTNSSASCCRFLDLIPIGSSLAGMGRLHFRSHAEADAAFSLSEPSRSSPHARRTSAE